VSEGVSSVDVCGAAGSCGEDAGSSCFVSANACRAPGDGGENDFRLLTSIPKGYVGSTVGLSSSFGHNRKKKFA